jgi:hypothetical protein
VNILEKKPAKLDSEQVDTLLSLQDFFYSNNIPHLALTQCFPGQLPTVLGFNEFIQEFIKFCAAETK